MPNPRTDPEMAPIYRAQDDSPRYSSSQVGFGTCGASHIPESCPILTVRASHRCQLCPDTHGKPCLDTQHHRLAPTGASGLPGGLMTCPPAQTIQGVQDIIYADINSLDYA